MRRILSLTALLLTSSAALLSAGARASSAPEARVINTSAYATPTAYSGPCPVVIKFKGKIATDGRAVVKYTWERSDRATAPVETLVFDAAGSKEVETDWTLGDARLLPHYEGWMAIKILSPNELESNRAAFVIDCEVKKPDVEYGGPTPTIILPPSGVAAVPALPQQQPDGLAAYQSILPELAAPRLRQLEKEMAEIGVLAEGLQARLKSAPRQPGFDYEQLEAEFRALMQEHDFEERARRAGKFRQSYEQQLMRQAEAAGIDFGAERQKLSRALGFSEADVSPGALDPRSLTVSRFIPEVVAVDDRPPATVSALSPPPDLVSRDYREPFTAAGSRGGEDHRTSASASGGSLRIRKERGMFGGSSQVNAFITQDLTVDSGHSQVNVSATLSDLSFSTLIISMFLGYGSAEAVVNLRVLEGTRVVASNTVSLARTAGVLLWSEGGGPRPLTLGCEFSRPRADAPGRYTIVVELEGLVSTGGLAGATVFAAGKLQRLRVFTQR